MTMFKRLAQHLVKTALILLAVQAIGFTDTCFISNSTQTPVPIQIAGCTFTGSLPSNSTSYIQNTSSLQSGATFFTSSGTVNTMAIGTSLKWPDGTVQVSSPSGNNFGTTGQVGFYSSNGAAISGSSNLIVTASSVSVASQVAVQSGINYSSQTTTLGSYALTSTDLFIAVNTSSGSALITLNAANARVGQEVYLVKTDTTSNIVTIRTAGNDTISFTTGTWIFNGRGQGIKLLSDGVSNWAAPEGMAATPPFIGTRTDGPSAAQSVSASSTTQLSAVYVTVPVRVTGLRYIVGVQSGNCQYGLYDNYGVLLASSTETTCAAGGVATTAFVSAVNIPPGIYYLAVGADNTSQTFTKASGNGMTCNNIAANLPMAKVTLPGTNTVNCFSVIGLVSGGVSQ